MSTCLVDKVFAFTEEKALLPTPCHVLLGVSGGADSMALLHVLTHWPTNGLRVSAVHVHHGLRAETADRDAQFVRAYCERNNVPLTVVHADVAAVAREEGLTLEEAGRRVRYAYFQQELCRIGADFIVTAHTASDQAETMLMHVVRGCGLDGLTGIPSMRGNIRRPLLCCTRDEIEAYCAENDLAFVLDESNEDTHFTRNFVRHRVLPALREMNPSVERALLRLREHCEEDAAYIQQMAHTALESAACSDGYLKSAFEQQPSVVRRRMIRELFQSVSLSVYEEIHIKAAEQAVLRGNMRMSLPNGWEFTVGQDVVSLYLPDRLSNIVPQMVSTLPAEFSFGAKKLRIDQLDVWDASNENVHNLFLNAVLDCDKIRGQLHVRCRSEGDYMHPAGRGVGKSLKKLMNEWRIPVHLRDQYPLICDDDGVLLVPRFACDERAKITEATKHYLVCKLLEV